MGRKRERDWVPRQEGNGKRSGSVLEDDLLAVRTLVMGDVTSHVDPADPVLSALLVVPSAGPATSCCTPCGLQEGWVWAPGSLIDQDVQGLLKDPGLWELHLGLLLLRGIDNGGATHLRDFAALPVERPAADFVAQHVLEEEQPPVEAQGQLVKQLDVLEEVVI